MQFNTFRTGGVIYKITDTIYVGKKNDIPKREMWLEVPTQRSMTTKTAIIKFETVFSETELLDEWEEGEWLDMVFTITSNKWTDPKTQEEKIFNSIRIVDAKVGKNPFAEKKDIQNKPEDLSNTIVSELADRVKDWSNEAPKQDTLFGDLDNDDLPF